MFGTRPQSLCAWPTNRLPTPTVDSELDFKRLNCVRYVICGLFLRLLSSHHVFLSFPFRHLGTLRRPTITTPVALASSFRWTTRRAAQWEGKEPETNAFHFQKINDVLKLTVLLYYLFFRAYVEKYLLEKSRLVYQEHNERWALLREADRNHSLAPNSHQAAVKYGSLQ